MSKPLEIEVKMTFPDDIKLEIQHAIEKIVAERLDEIVTQIKQNCRDIEWLKDQHRNYN